MQRKFLFNCLAVGVLVGSYFVASATLNALAAKENTTAPVFSDTKNDAELHYQNKRWKAAGQSFKQLIEKDPLNPGAHVNYAVALHFQLKNAIDRAKKKQGDSSERSVDPAVKEIADAVIEADRACLPFKKYRNISRFRLALVYGYIGETESAKEFLILALRDGLNPRKFQHFIANFRFYECEEILEDPEVDNLLEATWDRQRVTF